MDTNAKMEVRLSDLITSREVEWLIECKKRELSRCFNCSSPQKTEMILDALYFKPKLGNPEAELSASQLIKK